MIDTHSHIYDEAYAEDFDQVVARAKEAGVTRLVTPGIDISCYESMLATADRLDGYAVPTIGLHPTSVTAGWQGELQFVIDHIGDRPFCAVGEIGLDYYWSREFEKEQQQVFLEQIGLASEKDLPIIIHAREATEDIFRCIKKLGRRLRGVFHAFTGSIETYRQIKRLGDFKVGIGGVVTFKNAHVAETVAQIPLDDILLETDAPYLTPVPFRGRRNESSYVKFVAEKIAQVKGVGLEEVDNTTTANAEILFGICK
ncbi:MAG: TatD family hydrolase [Bacteroidales bacterium]|nr:TatD family hydrolase [Candidatus Equibacterium intestinale]